MNEFLIRRIAHKLFLVRHPHDAYTEVGWDGLSRKYQQYFIKQATEIIKEVENALQRS